MLMSDSPLDYLSVSVLEESAPEWRSTVLSDFSGSKSQRPEERKDCAES